MARAYQALIQVNMLSKTVPKKRLNILITKRTGFKDVWWNGQHFQYNLYKAFDDPADIDFNEIANFEQTTGRKVIMVRKKRKR